MVKFQPKISYAINDLIGNYRWNCYTFADCGSGSVVDLLKLQADSVVEGAKDSNVTTSEAEHFLAYVENYLNKKKKIAGKPYITREYHAGEIKNVSSKDLAYFLHFRGADFIKDGNLPEGFRKSIVTLIGPDKVSTPTDREKKELDKELNKEVDNLFSFYRLSDMQRQMVSLARRCYDASAELADGVKK